MEYMTKIIKICLWALALTPFIVNKFAFFPYATGESLFARGLLVLVSILFVFNYFYSKNFKDKIIEKIKIVIKNPIVISILAFILVFIISTIFAVNKYNAFWGTIERGEGLIGIIYFASLFIYSLLIFEKKDWLWFFKLSLVTTLVLIGKEFIQFFSGIVRPSSFLDNPTYLAGYLLFSIFCAVVVFENTIPRETEKIRSKNLSLIIWKYFSIITLISSILGIFITETRGTIAGLAVGFIFILIYGVIKGKNISYKKLNLRKISIILLCILFIFSAVFIGTRKSEIWQKVPGLSRVALISGKDDTTQTRLLMAQLSLQSVNPKEEGMKKLLIGWGPENFSLAYAKYFNPVQFSYEMGWFDRSHNKLFDTLVMNGLFGLIAYLAIWFFFFKAIFKRKETSLLNIGLLFLGVSLLVHLLFVFDQITTSIPFFAILSFTIYLALCENTNKDIEKHKQNLILNKSYIIYLGIFFSILCIFSSFLFLRNDLSAYFQMKKYILLKNGGDTKIMLDKIDSVFTPFTSAQMNIRNDLLLFTENNYNINNQSMVKLSDIAIGRAEEYVQKDPFDIRFLIYLGTAYAKKGNELKSPELLIKGEEYFKRMLVYAPNRPDSNMGLALSLFYEKKYDEAFNYFEKAYNLNPKYILEQIKTINNIYPTFFKYFYDTKNKDNFIKTAQRLKNSGYVSQDMFDQIINYMNKYNSWPNIDFGA